jgi:hypothetical protein
MNVSLVSGVPSLSPRGAIEYALGLQMPADQAREIATDALLALATGG